jgi:hypothetical protein
MDNDPAIESNWSAYIILNIFWSTNHNGIFSTHHIFCYFEILSSIFEAQVNRLSMAYVGKKSINLTKVLMGEQTD